MRIAAAVCLAALLAVPALAAPFPSYFPLNQGAMWTRRGDDGAEISIKVVGWKSVRGLPCAVVESRAVRRGHERVVFNDPVAAPSDQVLERGSELVSYRIP